MRSPLVTVAIVPRERFSFAKTSLDNILATTTGRYLLVYVDGNSPPKVRDHIASQAEQHSFQVIRRETYLSPNQARNLAAHHARTKYIVFIDNDTLVSPGWLEALVNCAEQTDAWVVGPIYCERLPAATRIHMAGGDARFVERNGSRILVEAHRHFGKPLAEVRPQLKREPTEQIEFHCALVRRDVFDRLGPLDEQLWSAAEHTDLCLAVREAGGQVYLEPGSVVTYVPPPPLAAADRPYFMLRWSDAWNNASLARFRAKWNLSADDPSLVFLSSWLAKHRRIAWHRVNTAAHWLGSTPARWLQNHVIGPLEGWINRLRYPGVTSHLGPWEKFDGVRAAHAEHSATRGYAQTNLQLYNQLIAQGCSHKQLRRVRAAYDLSMRLFSGHFRAMGKPFVAHLVGTASALAAHDAPFDVALAGLLHSVYLSGEFGDGSRGIDATKRGQVCEVVGSEAEQLIAAYTLARWSLDQLAALDQRASRLTAVESRIVQLKLADALDDHLDGALAFAPRKKLVEGTTNSDWARALIQMGRRSGHESLASELAALVSRGSAQVPPCLESPQAASFVMAPLSRSARIASRVARRFLWPNHSHRRAA